MVACGPPGLNGDTNILYHNNGDGTFTDVSAKSGILKANGNFGLGVLTADFDNDGWPDIYVADDSTASALYKNLHDGRFVDVGMEAGCVLSADGKPQAGMGVSAADYDLDGNLDIVKTNFAGDTPSLYHNLGNWNFEDTTFQAGLGAHTQYLGWGCGFIDYDNDGWPDILLCNGHVYPEVEQLKTEAGYPQRKILYKNLRNGRFEEVSNAGTGHQRPQCLTGRGFRRLRQRRRHRRRGQHRQRLSSAAALRFQARQQLDQGEVHRHQVEPQRHWRAPEVRHAILPTSRSRTRRSTKCAAAAATSRRTICASTSAWAKPTRPT